MIADWYPEILAVHIGCVVLSGSLFAIRGVLHIRQSALAHHARVRAASHMVDTVLLIAAVLLTLILRQYPLVDGWLTAKVLWLLGYIALGMITLRCAHTPIGRAAAFATALVVFAFIVGIAVVHRPAGWLALIR